MSPLEKKNLELSEENEINQKLQENVIEIVQSDNQLFKQTQQQTFHPLTQQNNQQHTFTHQFENNVPTLSPPQQQPVPHYPTPSYSLPDYNCQPSLQYQPSTPYQQMPLNYFQVPPPAMLYQQLQQPSFSYMQQNPQQQIMQQQTSVTHLHLQIQQLQHQLQQQQQQMWQKQQLLTLQPNYHNQRYAQVMPDNIEDCHKKIKILQGVSFI